MYYIVNNNQITLLGNDYNFLQNMNPKTGELFKTNDEAIAWAKEFIERITESQIITCKMTLPQELKSDTDIKIVLEFGEAISGKHNVRVTELDKDIEIVITDGKAELIMNDKPGIYHLMFNDIVTIDDKKYCILHEENEYTVTIQ